MKTEIRQAYEDLHNVELLFREYKEFLGEDLGFQHYEEEIAALPGKYALPDGRLYLAYVEDVPAGCVGLRRFGDSGCEIKRLYVREQYRGCKLGSKLVLQLIEDAKCKGYKKMYLDTLESLESAVAMYRKLGFYEIPAYYNNPLEGTLYFCLDL